jgi:hypothetical protein
MPIPEAILDQIKCCLSNDGHIVHEPILLNCGANCCKNCIRQSRNYMIPCFGCNGHHEKILTLLNAPINKIVETIIHSSLDDLIEHLDVKIQNATAFMTGLMILVH